MSDVSAANILYPSMPSSAPAVSAPETSAAAPSTVAVSAGNTSPEPQTRDVAPSLATPRTTLAEKLPVDMPKSFESVRWHSEPPATSTVEYNNFVLSEISDGQHVVDAAMHTQALDAMQSAGLGATQARFFYDMAKQAALNPPTTDRATAEATLRDAWGGRYEANLASISGLIDKAQKSWPGVRQYLTDSGLGNDPRFLIAAARKARGN